MSDDLFSLVATGETLRNAGMDQTASHNADWIDHALLIVAKHAPRNQDFMAEVFRSLPGIGAPRHPNAWGALTNAAIRHGLIVPTGRYEKARGSSNHAHQYKVYRRP